MIIIFGVVIGILVFFVCIIEIYEYEVFGVVQGQQIDYDCFGEDIVFDMVVFEVGSGRGIGFGGRSFSGKKFVDVDDLGEQVVLQGEKVVIKVFFKVLMVIVGFNNGLKVVMLLLIVKKVSNKGVKLKSKLEKLERLKGLKILKVLYKVKLKGCEIEYEIFVFVNDGYLYEQDIWCVDYESCEKVKILVGEKVKVFLFCIKG